MYHIQSQFDQEIKKNGIFMPSKWNNKKLCHILSLLICNRIDSHRFTHHLDDNAHISVYFWIDSLLASNQKLKHQHQVYCLTNEQTNKQFESYENHRWKYRPRLIWINVITKQINEPIATLRTANVIKTRQF